MENLFPPHSPNENSKRIKTPPSQSSINNFPDYILSHIISFLPTKDAFKTSVLSKRWIPICHTLSTLHIDDNTENKIHMLRLVEAFMLSPHTQHLPLQSLVLDCPSQFWDSNTDTSTFQKCLEAAKRRCLVYLYISLLYVPLPPTIFSLKTLVTMILVKMRPPHTLFDSSVDLPSLKTLYLCDVRFHHIEDFIILLSGCPVLEKLSTLHIKANDMSMTLPKGYLKPLSKLIKSGIRLLEVPLKAVYNVQFLSIVGMGRNLINKEINSYYKDLPVFENLTILYLSWSNNINTHIHDWDEVLKMLQNCPKLRYLSITKAKSILTKEDSTYPYHVPRCLSAHLISCIIKNYEAIEADFLFATYLLQNARHLQVMSISRTLQPKPMESPRFLDDLFSCSRISPTCKLTIFEP